MSCWPASARLDGDAAASANQACAELNDLDPFLSCPRRDGQARMTRVSCTSSIISAAASSNVSVWPLLISLTWPRQCTFAPFHPTHSICTWPDVFSFDGGLYVALTCTREISLFADSW